MRTTTKELWALLLAMGIAGCEGGRDSKDLVGETPSSDAGDISVDRCASYPAPSDYTSCLDECSCRLGDRNPCILECSSQFPPDPGPTPREAPHARDPMLPPLPIPSGPMTLSMTSFDVMPGEESFQCQTFANPLRRDVDVLVSESFMTKGSHHLFAFLNDDYGSVPLTACGGLEFNTYIHSAQVEHLRTTYPPGIGRFLPREKSIKILTHYLNSTLEPIRANVRLELTVVDPAMVTAQASDVFMNNYGLSVPPRSQSSAQHSCTLPRDIKLLASASHMHQRGVHFIATIPDGTTLYETTSWDEPEQRLFDPPMEIPAGTPVTWTCDYDNTSDSTLTFGQSAKYNEMCIFTGIYYPAPNGEGIECLL